MKSNAFFRALLCAVFIIIFAALTLLIAVPGYFLDSGKTDKTASSTPTVIIDAGHGGEDGGAVGSDGTFEKDLNLDIALLLGDLLRERGVNVIMTRTEDILLYDRNVDFKGRKKALDLKARMDISKNNPGAIFVSIHMNAFTQKKYDGLQVYYPMSDENSMRLAQIIQDCTRELLQPNNQRKPKAAGSNIFLLNGNPNTAVLIECGFLSNDAECARLNDPEYRRALAQLFCDSIFKYLDNPAQSP